MASPDRLRALLACAALAPAIAAGAPAADQRQPLVVPLNVEGAFAVGGSYHQVLAQVVTAGRAGTLVAIAAPATCSEGTSLLLEIRGVRTEAEFGRTVPDGTVRATGAMPAALLPYFADPTAPDFRMLPLSQPVPLAAGEVFSFVLSSAGECALVQAPVGDLYAGGDASFIDDVHRPYYEWLRLGLGRLDLPFETWMDDAGPDVRIDVKPGSDVNPVNLGARGSIPVAILGSASFDAGTVDLASVRFAGASPVANRRGRPRASLEDVNADGIADLVLHFPIPALALRAGDTEAWLTGSTVDGAELTASDRIRVVPAPKRPGLVF